MARLLEIPIKADLIKKSTNTYSINAESTGVYFKIDILKNGEKFDLTDKTVRAYMLKKDKKVIYIDCTLENKNNELECFLDVTTQMLNAEYLTVQFLITDTEGSTVVSNPVYIAIGDTVIDTEAIESSNEFSALQQALTSINNLSSAASPLMANTVADMTDSTRCYVYTGTEEGYSKGYLYYWNGTEWTKGWSYQATQTNAANVFMADGTTAEATVNQLKEDLVNKASKETVTNIANNIDTINNNISNLDETKVNKNEIANGLNAKGACLYAELPSENNSNGDYYYCSDGNGTDGAGNYVWNGTAWFFGGLGNNFGAKNVKLTDGTNTEDNITGLKYSFNKGYKTLKCDFKNKKIDDTGAEVDSTTTVITDKLSLDEYKSVEISCTGKYKVMVFKYNADDSFNSKIANTVSSFTIDVVKGCKYIIQFWKSGDTNLKDALLRTTIKGEIEADENAKNIIAEIYNEFNNGVRELLYNREPYYLATDYGISTQNDDNSEALQTLMDYVYSNGGGTILYPNGDYKYSITETTHNYAVCLKPGVSIVGEDKYLTRFIMNDCNGKAYSLFWRLIGANSPLANAHFEKFTVDGSALTTWGVEGKAFYAQYVKHCIFKDLYLIGTPATALGIDFLDDVTIDHITCENCGRLWTTGKTGSAGIGIGTGGYENENFIITNNVCVGSGQYGIFVESQKLLTSVGNYESSKGMIIANNTVRNGLNNGIGVRNVKGITITGNTVYENANNGIYIEGGTDIIIGCNTIFDNTANGINITADDKFKNCNNVCVYGNTINKNGVNGILIDNTSTSLINNNISITGNQTSDNTEKGISLTGAIKNLYVNGNAIFDSIENNATVTGVNTVQTA